MPAARSTTMRVIIWVMLSKYCVAALRAVVSPTMTWNSSDSGKMFGSTFINTGLMMPNATKAPTIT